MVLVLLAVLLAGVVELRTLEFSSAEFSFWHNRVLSLALGDSLRLLLNEEPGSEWIYEKPTPYAG